LQEIHQRVVSTGIAKLKPIAYRKRARAKIKPSPTISGILALRVTSDIPEKRGKTALTKEERLAHIKSIVSQQDIETQEELLTRLQADHIHVTQATISRDIKELQLTKVVGTHGRYIYALPAQVPHPTWAIVRHRIVEVFVSLARAQNLLVLKVLPGHAHSVAWLFDNIEVPGLLGTLAGDDTILLILTDENSAQSLQTELSV
jgi:transcriptional regulator of arginine metabolism